MEQLGHTCEGCEAALCAVFRGEGLAWMSVPVRCAASLMFPPRLTSGSASIDEIVSGWRYKMRPPPRAGVNTPLVHVPLSHGAAGILSDFRLPLFIMRSVVVGPRASHARPEKPLQSSKKRACGAKYGFK